ncbi:MAG: sigma 54-interacting transcriptional regulator [Nannocystaceae bacterium]
MRKVAPFKTTVLVLGESGVGKELVSRAIHRLSPRADGPFVAVNCGAIPEALLESELFGHVRGAFTDATATSAACSRRAGGKWDPQFLDEIGELPLALVQVKLAARALQEEEIRRSGTPARSRSTRELAATSRELAQMVEDGSFRQDSYYRLHVMPIEVPPLRERREDIAPLLEHFIAAINRRLGTKVQSVADDALARLLAYHWPGNVRELENTVEHAAVMAEGGVLQPADLPERVLRTLQVRRRRHVGDPRGRPLGEAGSNARSSASSSRRALAIDGNCAARGQAARAQPSRAAVQDQGVRPWPGLAAAGPAILSVRPRAARPGRSGRFGRRPAPRRAGPRAFEAFLGQGAGRGMLAGGASARARHGRPLFAKDLGDLVLHDRLRAAGSTRPDHYNDLSMAYQCHSTTYH